MNLKPREFQISMHFLNSPTVTSKVLISNSYLTFLPTTIWLHVWRMKSSNLPISPKCFTQFIWNFRIMFTLYLMNTSKTQMKKMSKFWFIWPLNRGNCLISLPIDQKNLAVLMGRLHNKAGGRIKPNDWSKQLCFKVVDENRVFPI